MTAPTTKPAAEGRPSEWAVEAATDLMRGIEQEMHAWLGTSKPIPPELIDAAAAIVQHKAITPALARQQQAVDELVKALKAERALIHKAQDLLGMHLVPDSRSDDAEVLNELYGILDGPGQREASRLSLNALAKAKG